MPAILRIFLYQTGASHTVIGSTVSYGQIQGQGSDLGQHEDLEQYEVVTLDVQAYPGRQQDDHDPEQDGSHFRYRLRIHWA